MNITHALQILVTSAAKTAGLENAEAKVARLSKSVNFLSKSAAFLSKVIAALGVIKLSEWLFNLPGAMADVVIGTLDVSAALEGMRDAMWGIAGEAAPAMLEKLREAASWMSSEQGLLRQYNSAYMLLGRTLADRLPEAYKYLSKVALATGDEVNYLMERLTRSVGRLSTRWMAYIGTVVNLEEATAWAAQMTGKLVSELTREEIQAAMLDRVLMKLEARTSALPDPLGKAQQLIKSLAAELITLRTDLSDHFLPTAKSFLTLILNLVKGFQLLTREGGILYHPLRKLAATLTVSFELASEAVTKLFGLVDAGSDKIDSFVDNVSSIAWKALSWGANIITNLAIGIIKGASYALVGAMNFVSRLLEEWLGPGSAPKVVSNILDWGASAFTEFLRGFSMAQFDVLEGVQRPLKRALDILVKSDLLEASKSFEIFTGLSEKMATALEHFGRTGEVLGGVFEDLSSQIGGGYGESLAVLWRRQLDLAAAVKRLTTAELRLKAAREDEEESNTKLSKSAREYNKLVRQGADPAFLRMKLQGVKADYAALEAARLETEAAEDAEEQAAKEVKSRKEEVRLQERLLNQLLAMGKAMVDLAAARKKEAEEPFELPGIEWPEIHVPRIDQAFEDLKDSIREKFENLWSDIAAKWEASGAIQYIDNLKDAFERLKTKGAPVFNWLTKQWSKWEKWWDVNGPKIVTGIEDIYVAVKSWSAENIFQWALDEWDRWINWWRTDGPAIKIAIDQLKEWFGDLQFSLTGDRDGIWTWLWEKMKKITERGLKLILSFVSLNSELLRRAFSQVAHLITGDWEGFKNDLISITERLLNFLNEVSNGMLDTVVETFRKKHRDILADGKKFGKDYVDTIRDSLGFHSPSKYFIEMGENMVNSINQGIRNEVKTPIGSMTGALRVANPYASMGGADGARSIVIHNYFGVDSIRSDRDIYKLAEQIQRGLTLRGVRDTL